MPARYATADLGPEFERTRYDWETGQDVPDLHYSRPSYGDTSPAWMKPECHPDYRALPTPKKYNAGKPDSIPKSDRPYRWQDDPASKPHTIANHCARLKRHPKAKTWKGSYPDAPPSGQDGPRAPAFEVDPGGCYVYVRDWPSPTQCSQPINTSHGLSSVTTTQARAAKRRRLAA